MSIGSDTSITLSPVQPAIVGEILAEHRAVGTAVRSSLEHARRAGELLLELKAAVGHGGFGSYCAEHLTDIAETTIRGYMRVASRWNELETGNGVADLPLRQALQLLASSTAGPREATAAVPPLAPEQATALMKRRGDIGTSRKAKDRPDRIVEVTVLAAAGLLDDIVDENGHIDATLISSLDAELRPIWASELRQAAKDLARLANALAPRARR